MVGVDIQEADGAYEVSRMGAQHAPEDWSEDKTRNETDIIKTRVTKMIEQDLKDDPYAQEAFSALLRQAIEEAEKLFDHPLKQYLLFKEFEQQVSERRLDELPDAFQGNRHAQAVYGVFKQALPKVLSSDDSQVQQLWINLAFEACEVVDDAVAVHSINPQNIEAAIRKQLLPVVFRQCKSVGAGMDQAKQIVESIVQITRVGLAT